MSTTNYGWNLPTVGGDEDTWGDELNATVEAIDVQMAKTGEQLLSSGAITAATALDIALPAANAPAGGSPWREFRLKITELEPVNDAVSLQALLAYDGVPTFRTGTGEYAYSGQGIIGGVVSAFGAPSLAGTPAQPAITLHGGTFSIVGGQNPGLDMRIRMPAVGGSYTSLTWVLDFLDTTNDYDALFTGRARCTALSSRATHLRLKFSAGNISGARWALFGIPGL